MLIAALGVPAHEVKIKHIVVRFLLDEFMACDRGGLKLREHPLLSHSGQKSWPPTWTWIDGTKKKKPKGEVGILKEVKVSKTANRCFLVVDHQRSTYMGTLFLNDFSSFVRVVAWLY